MHKTKLWHLFQNPWVIITTTSSSTVPADACLSMHPNKKNASSQSVLLSASCRRIIYGFRWGLTCCALISRLSFTGSFVRFQKPIGVAVESVMEAERFKVNHQRRRVCLLIDTGT